MPVVAAKWNPTEPWGPTSVTIGLIARTSRSQTRGVSELLAAVPQCCGPPRADGRRPCQRCRPLNRSRRASLGA